GVTRVAAFAMLAAAFLLGCEQAENPKVGADAEARRGVKPQPDLKDDPAPPFDIDHKRYQFRGLNGLSSNGKWGTATVGGYAENGFSTIIVDLATGKRIEAAGALKEGEWGKLLPDGKRALIFNARGVARPGDASKVHSVIRDIESGKS